MSFTSDIKTELLKYDEKKDCCHVAGIYDSADILLFEADAYEC